MSHKYPYNFFIFPGGGTDCEPGQGQGGAVAGAAPLLPVPRFEVKVLSVCTSVLRAKLLGIKNKAFLCHAPSSPCVSIAL